MIYSVPIFYEVKENIEVDLPEGTSMILEKKR